MPNRSTRGAASLAALVLLTGPAFPQALPPPASTLVPATPEVVIRFQGGDLPTNVAHVLDMLIASGFVKTQPREVTAGQNVCAVYQEQLQVTGCNSATLALAKRVNPRLRTMDRLKEGQQIRVPDVALRSYSYVMKYDRSVKSDREQMSQRADAWRDRLQKSDVAPDGSSRLTFEGFELKVPVDSDAKAQELLARLEGIRGPNVLTSATYAAPRDYKRYSLDPPQRFFEGCQHGTPPASGDEGDLRLFLGEAAAQCTRTCTAEAENCPEVVLIDTPVARHPDLSKALLPLVPDDGTGDTTARECKVIPFDEKAHHGTHLAGIIAAAQNGFGFVGIAPQSSILSIPRDTPDPVLADWIAERDEKAGLPIYVFASNWDNGTLTKAEQRFARNAIARAVRDVRPLWIAAAGDEGGDLSALWRFGPQNLGDLENVLLVSACGDCSAAAPTLMPTANRSPTMVHLAAPGKDVPSTAGAGQYAIASGTSQSTAFVAGVAAAMTACYPQRYTKPHQIKSRLQATSRPFPAVESGSERGDRGLASGVLDAQVALLDPNQDWLKKTGQARAAVRIKKWVDGEVNLLDPVTRRPLERSPVRTRDIQRLVQVPHPDSTGGQWVAYTKVAFDNEHRGDVVRVGPGVLSGDQGTRAMLELCDGTQVPASQVEDVLMATTGRTCP